MNLIKKWMSPRINKIFGAFLLLGLLFAASGCGEKDYTLHFKKEMALDYGSNASALSLIDKVGDKKVGKQMYKNGTLEIDNFIIEVGKVDTNKLGTYEMKYTTNATENRFFTKSVKVKDISAPKIKVDKKTFEMTFEEYKNFNFGEVIKVIDNWKDDQPIINLTVGEITGEGKYTVKITATDIFKNKSSKRFTLIIIEPKKEEKPKEEPAPPADTPSGGGSTNNGGGNTSVPTPTPTPPAPSTPKPSSRDFLFTDGYTMGNVGEACQSALMSSGHSGTCVPIKDGNGIYLGMRLTFY